MTLEEKKAKLQAEKWNLLQSAFILILFIASTVFSGILVSMRKGLMWANIADLSISGCICGMWLSDFIMQLKTVIRLKKEIEDMEE